MSKIKNELKNDPLMPLRHTAEHVLHTAMQELYPGLKKVMGPPIEDGFYFDFDLDQSISPENFPEIEKKMQDIINAKLPMEGRETSLNKAKELFKDNQYKLERLNEIEESGEKIVLYSLGAKEDKHYDIDLCAGPHVKNTSEIKAFKLLSVAGAYYKGSEKNKMLQRIYATAFKTNKDLDVYLNKIEEAKKRDHRKLGQELDLFTFSDLVGSGLPLWTPKGNIIKKELYKYIIDINEKYGALEVSIPHMAKIELYEISGHAEKFKDELFKVSSHYNTEFVLKPVNCPHHTQIYASKPRSYRELPIRYVESTQQHRDEKPGELGGLQRTRSFEVEDGHTFCSPDQIKQEAINIAKIVEEFYSGLNMWDNKLVSLSIRDPKTPEKYIGNEKDWEIAENMIKQINKELNLSGKIMEGEAALYGPKIDYMRKDALGKETQLATIQIDFAMPKRFELTYIDKDGQKKTPVMLHRAILGSYERFIMALIENYAGAFPVWLSPVQVSVIPIGEKHTEYAKKITEKLKKNGIRVELNDMNDTMQAKIRDAQMQKIPYMFIIGDREVTKKQISIRFRTGKSLNGLSVNEAVKKIRYIYLTKGLDLW